MGGDVKDCGGNKGSGGMGSDVKECGGNKGSGGMGSDMEKWENEFYE